MDKDIEELIGAEKLRIIEQRKRAARDRNLYVKTKTIVEYLAEEKDRQFNIISGNASVTHEFKEGGLTVTCYEISRLLGKSEMNISVENDNQLVFEFCATKTWEEMMTAYIPGEEWEIKIDNLYIKADAIRQERAKYIEKEERLEKQRKAEEILRKYGLK